MTFSLKGRFLHFVYATFDEDLHGKGCTTSEGWPYPALHSVVLQFKQRSLMFNFGRHSWPVCTPTLWREKGSLLH